MGWRKTGIFREAEEILVLTCDICERDIGTEDEHRPRAHFRVSCHPNRGAINDQEPAIALCSSQCLQAFAAKTEDPDRTSGSDRALRARPLR